MHRSIVQEGAGPEILETYMYYESIQTGLGERFLRQVEKYFHQIQDNPQHFQIKKEYIQRGLYPYISLCHYF